MTFDVVNRLYKEVGEAVFNPGQDKLDVRFPQGESIGEVRERVLTAMRTIAGEGYRCVGLAVHGGT